MRTLTTSCAAALTSVNVPILTLVQMDFSSGMLRVTNAGQTFTWDGHDWLGVGHVGSIDAVEEVGGLEAKGMNFQISGVPAENISTALTTDYQGRDVRMWLTPLTHGYQVIADPVLVYVGRMDVMKISLGESAVITLSSENRLVDLGRPRVRRYTAEDQAIDDPNDRGFDFLPQMVEKTITWGRA